MTIDEINAISRGDVSKMTEAELRKIVREEQKAVTQRMRRLEKTPGGVNSPAYQALQRSGGKISTKGKSKAELQEELIRGQRFLNPSTKTATVKGFKSYVKKIGDKSGIKLDPENIDVIQEAFAKMAELYPDFYTRFYNTQKTMKQYIKDNPGATVDDLMQVGVSYVEKVYMEKQQEAAARNKDFDDEFDDYGL